FAFTVTPRSRLNAAVSALSSLSFGGTQACEPGCSAPSAARWPRIEASPFSSKRFFNSSGTSCSTSMSGAMPWAWIERPDGVKSRGGQRQRAVAGAERDDGLHRALAEGTRADQRRALVVAQRAGHDLGSGSRAAGDQHAQRLAPGAVAASRGEALGFLRAAAARRDLLAARHEGARH